MNKIIWTCWLQGRENAPDAVERCISSWETLNPDWDIRCLDAETVTRYIDLDEHIDLKKQTITAASLSDILRMLLLHEYGGVWVDATLYCNQPLNEWLPLAMGENGFFAFSKPAPDKLLASWFIAAAPGNRLITKWVARIVKYWYMRSNSDDYFWLHHEFDELCFTDREALVAWESVPKISANGPHVIQIIGMYEIAKDYLGSIDWATPVFKLVHKLDEDAYRPGCLIHHVLHSRELVKPKCTKIVSDESQDEARIAGLKVSTDNLGDHIQIIAGLRLLKMLGLSPEQWIDRDNEIAGAISSNEQQQSLGILLNGWFKRNPTQWPPRSSFNPIYLGFHIRLSKAPTLVSDEALEHYRKFGPIGCRDRYTQSLLKSHNVDAYISHCLSLTLPRRIIAPEKQTEILIISRDKTILDYLPSEISSGKFVCHYSSTTDFSENIKLATEMLTLYRSRAKLIVTTMLHCALPAIAMGIPVVVFYPPNKGEQHYSDIERFSSLQEIMRVFYLNEVDKINWQGYTIDVSHIKLTLIDRMFELSKRWGRIPGTRLEPIAPASALPLPSIDQINEFMRNRARNRALTNASDLD